MPEQTSAETVVFLPWTVEPQPQTQAITLKNPEQQKIYVDLAHSTDWVVVWSVFVSAFISLVGFLVTIYVVKKSTEAQISSNRELIENQNALLNTELQWKKEKEWISNFKGSVASYISTITNFLYHAGMFQSNYLQDDASRKRDPLSESGRKFEAIRDLLERAIMITCELDLQLDSKNKEHEQLIYLCDYFNRHAMELLDEYLMIQDSYHLKKFKKTGVSRQTDQLAKELYAQDDLDEMENKNRIEVIAVIMRKINTHAKVLINKEAA